MLNPMEANLVRALLLANAQAMNKSIKAHKAAGHTLAATLCQSNFNRTHVVIDKLIAFTCSEHDWKTDATGLLDKCALCGEERA